MNRINRMEQLGVEAMMILLVLSLLAGAAGKIGLAILLFLAIAIPLPMLASFRAREHGVVEPNEGNADTYDVSPNKLKHAVRGWFRTNGRQSMMNAIARCAQAAEGAISSWVDARPAELEHHARLHPRAGAASQTLFFRN